MCILPCFYILLSLYPAIAPHETSQSIHTTCHHPNSPSPAFFADWYSHPISGTSFPKHATPQCSPWADAPHVLLPHPQYPLNPHPNILLNPDSVVQAPPSLVTSRSPKLAPFRLRKPRNTGRSCLIPVHFRQLRQSSRILGHRCLPRRPRGDPKGDIGRCATRPRINPRGVACTWRRGRSVMCVGWMPRRRVRLLDSFVEKME